MSIYGRVKKFVNNGNSGNSGSDGPGGGGGDDTPDPTPWQTIMPIVIGVGFFLTALAWNDAVVSQINHSFSGNPLFTVSSKELTVKWVYAVMISLTLLLLVIITQQFIKSKSVELIAHEEGGYVVSPVVSAGLPAEPI